jgi:hypothetical protein
LTLLLGVAGGSVSLSLCVLFMSFELLRPLWTCVGEKKSLFCSNSRQTADR